jgi:hypothetical protein
MKISRRRLSVLLLAVFVGCTVAWIASYRMRFSDAELCYTAFHDRLCAGDYKAAYGMMVQQYRDTHSLEDFRQVFNGFGSSDYALGLWRSSVFSKTQQTWTLHPSISVIGEAVGPGFVLKQEDGQWVLTGEVVLSYSIL